MWYVYLKIFHQPNRNTKRTILSFYSGIKRKPNLIEWIDENNSYIWYYAKVLKIERSFFNSLCPVSKIEIETGNATMPATQCLKFIHISQIRIFVILDYCQVSCPWYPWKFSHIGLGPTIHVWSLLAGHHVWYAEGTNCVYVYMCMCAMPVGPPVSCSNFSVLFCYCHLVVLVGPLTTTLTMSPFWLHSIAHCWCPPAKKYSSLFGMYLALG